MGVLPGVDEELRVHLARGSAGDNLALDADARGGLGQLAADARLQIEQRVESLVGEEAADEDLGMRKFIGERSRC